MLCLLLAMQVAYAASAPRLFYSKSFPGSVPPYVAISVEKSGGCEYRETPDEEPLKFQLSEAETSELFTLADRLDNFKRPLESGLKVAKMGVKTFRFEDGQAKSEVQFNFTEDVDGRALHDWFERIAETEQHLINLERAAKYDKLGVNKALLQLEASYDRKRLVSMAQFLPMLDRIAKNETYLHMARTRAAGLADSIRAAK